MASRQAAIRMKCADCSAGDSTAIRCYPAIRCPLWPYRMGYSSSRNQIYYDRDLYREHEGTSSAEFNRILKERQLNAQKIA